MNTCYDGRHPVKLIALVAALSLPAQAQLWHATVEPPRPGLPAVTIDLGYPGPYLPPLNSPIAMRASAAGVPFDGYIGYHFEVNQKATLDTPVVARAVVAPGKTWSFETMLTMRKWGGGADAVIAHREIVVEWRDRALKTIASKSAGVPAWSAPMPLRIAAPGTLSDRAQWYAGFSSVIAPLQVWIDLPRPVRDAILGSGIHVVLFGLPRGDQHFDDVDRALLPVTFTSTAGSYVRPWPYGQSQIASPMSWRAKDGADFVSASSCAYLVRTIAATWIADDAAVGRPLPAMVRSDGSRSTVAFIADPYTAPHDYRPAALSGAMLAMSGLAWLFVRRKSRIVIAAALIAVTAGVITFERNRIRPPAAVVDRVTRMPVAPGIVDELHILREHGPAPLAGHATDRASVTGDFGFPENAEVRGSGTAASMGVLDHAIDWDSTVRWIYRRRVDASSAVPATFVQADIGDLHSAMNFWRLRRPQKVWSFIYGVLQKRSDGKLVCAFALAPATSETATLSVIAGDEVEVTTAAGTTILKATRRDVYAPPTAAIPENILRDIIRSGGIFEVAIRPKEGLVRPLYWAAIRVQEKKS